MKHRSGLTTRTVSIAIGHRGMKELTMRARVVGAIAVAWMAAMPVSGFALQSAAEQTSSTSAALIALRVTAFRGTIRQAASATATILKAVPAGTLLEGVRQDGDWFVVQVVTADNRPHEGFINGSAVEVVAASPAAAVAGQPPTHAAAAAAGPAPPAALPRDLDPKESVRQQLQVQYVETRLSDDAMRVLRAGTVLTIQKEGLAANRVPGTMAGMLVTFVNNYKDGQIKPSVASRLLIARELTRYLQVGERVYLLKVEARDTEVVVSILACGTCDPTLPDPAFVPYKSAVAFQFPKGYLRTVDVSRIEETIGQVLGFAPADSDSIREQGLPPAEPPGGVTTAADAAAPATIEIGQTIDQVVVALGTPATIVRAGSKEIYVYKDLKVTFLDGRVSDVE